jgi:hypothetical protein
MNLWISMTLLSDATFARSGGVAGLLDVEIEHDHLGCPMVGGRTLKGLLVEEWTQLAGVLATDARWAEAARFLFGAPGTADARMRVGDACLPPRMRALIARTPRPASTTLDWLTTVRRQTALDSTTGAPQEGSLRAAHAARRGLILLAPLHFSTPPDACALALLAACTLAVRRGGSVRNRGRGRVALRLHEGIPSRDPQHDPYTITCLGALIPAQAQEVAP